MVAVRKMKNHILGSLKRKSNNISLYKIWNSKKRPGYQGTFGWLKSL